MASPKAESREHQARIKDLLEKLRNKLKSFTAINLQAQVLGQIRDFYLDKSRRLYMVIEQPEAQGGSPLRLLSSKYINKIDTANKAVFIDLSLAELDRSPVYEPSSGKVIELPNPSSTLLTDRTTMTSASEIPNFNETPSLTEQSSATDQEEDNENFEESDDTPEVVEEEIVRLLEERLIVNRSKRKVGEVVVRKEIETRIVEVPVQREKLIIEQVGEETKLLAEIDLGHGEVIGAERMQVPSSHTRAENPYTVTGEFISPKAASDLLEAIALQGRHGCKKVRVELILEGPEFQESYQKMFDRCSTR